MNEDTALEALETMMEHMREDGMDTAVLLVFGNAAGKMHVDFFQKEPGNEVTLRLRLEMLHRAVRLAFTMSQQDLRAFLESRDN